jgi:uncharacterized protein (DUF2384 family)
MMHEWHEKIPKVNSEPQRDDPLSSFGCPSPSGRWHGRVARATLTAAEILGDFEAARIYMHTPNYVLGGYTPAELIKTSEGERIVLNELHAQAEGGPL